MVPPASHKVSRVSWYSGAGWMLSDFVYATITLFGPGFPAVHSTRPITPHRRSATPLNVNVQRFGLIRVRSPLLTDSRLISLPGATKMFQFAPFPTTGYTCSPAAGQAFTLTGFPHSDICGSRDICSSPQLFAACHVLLRLQSPRHSPCALCNLTFFWFSRRSSLTHKSWMKSLSFDKRQNVRFVPSS